MLVPYKLHHFSRKGIGKYAKIMDMTPIAGKKLKHPHGRIMSISVYFYMVMGFSIPANMSMKRNSGLVQINIRLIRAC